MSVYDFFTRIAQKCTHFLKRKISEDKLIWGEKVWVKTEQEGSVVKCIFAGAEAVIIRKY